MQIVLSSIDEVRGSILNEVDQAGVLFLVKNLKALSKPQNQTCHFDFELRIFNIMANLCTYVYSYLNRSMSFPRRNDDKD